MAPPLARPWKFLKATLYEKVRFLPFSSKNCKIQQCLMVFFISIQYVIKIAMWDYIWHDAVIFCVYEFPKKWANLRLPLNVQKECFSFRGGFAPWPPDQRICPWTLLGAPPPDPVIGSRSQCPLCQILNTPLILSTFSTSSSWLRHCCGHPDQGVRWGKCLNLN